MNELIQKVMDKAGISADQSKISVETVLEFIKGKLPPGILDSVLGGKAADGTAGTSGASDVLGRIGGMFGKG